MINRFNVTKLIPVLLLAFYSLGIVHSLLPILKDFVAHAFNEFDHINTVHYSNGKYHVHKEFSDSENSKKKHVQADLSKKIDVHYVQSHLLASIQEQDQQIEKLGFSFSKINYHFELDAPLLPPKLVTTHFA